MEYGEQKQQRIINDFSNHHGRAVDRRLSAETTAGQAMSPIQATGDARFSSATNDKMLRSRFCQTAHFGLAFLNFSATVQFAAHHDPCPLTPRPADPA